MRVPCWRWYPQPVIRGYDPGPLDNAITRLWDGGRCGPGEAGVVKSLKRRTRRGLKGHGGLRLSEGGGIVTTGQVAKQRVTAMMTPE